METKTTTPKSKGGRTTTAERMQNMSAVCTYRQMGKTLKETAQIVGITEKTAGKYERQRLKSIGKTAELITLLEAKAKAIETTPKDLVLLTKEIDRLNDKVQKNGTLF